MTGVVNKDAVTLIIPCLNEASVIATTVSHYHALGYKNVLVLDDSSTDETAVVARQSKARVITNQAINGYTTTALRGLYNVKTDYALLTDPTNEFTEMQLESFLEFGVLGNYGILFTKWTEDSQSPISTVAKHLKEKFGIFIDDPDYELVFINSKIIEASKTEPTVTEKFFFFSLITFAINSKQKIGTFNINSQRYFGNGKWRRVSRRLRTKRINKLHDDYFHYTFPDFEKKKFNNQLIVAICGALVGGVVTFLAQYALSLSSNS